MIYGYDLDDLDNGKPKALKKKSQKKKKKRKEKEKIDPSKIFVVVYEL